MNTEVISNNQPHKVTLAEGSTVAKGKSAISGEVTVHRTLESEKSKVPEESQTPDRFSGDVDNIKTTKSTVGIPAELQKMALPSAKLGKELGKDYLKESALVAQKTKDLSGTVDSQDMNFPARLIHLKIENDKVRKEIESLE